MEHYSSTILKIDEAVVDEECDDGGDTSLSIIEIEPDGIMAMNGGRMIIVGEVDNPLSMRSHSVVSPCFAAQIGNIIASEEREHASPPPDRQLSTVFSDVDDTNKSE